MVRKVGAKPLPQSAAAASAHVPRPAPADRPTKNIWKPIGIAVLSVFALLFVAGIVGAIVGPSDDPSTATASSSESAAAPTPHPRVATSTAMTSARTSKNGKLPTLEDALVTLQQKCGDDAGTLQTEAANAQADLAKHGISEEPDLILRNVAYSATVLPDGGGGCAQYIAAYLILKEHGG